MSAFVPLVGVKRTFNQHGRTVALMELPAGRVQEYISAAGITAVYVARLPSGACQPGPEADDDSAAPARSRFDKRRAFWVDDTKVATRISKSIRRGGGSLTGAPKRQP